MMRIFNQGYNRQLRCSPAAFTEIPSFIILYILLLFACLPPCRSCFSWFIITSERCSATFNAHIQVGAGGRFCSTSLWRLCSTTNQNDPIEKDTRPYEQRRDGPRAARRMNQSFQYLYRHKDEAVLLPKEDDSISSTLDAQQYLIQYGGFTIEDISKMTKIYPSLHMLDVDGKIKPMLKFIKYTLGGLDNTFISHEDQFSHLPQDSNTPTHMFFQRYINIIREARTKQQHNSNALPLLSNGAKATLLKVPQIFGARLERTVAPRHAFLVFQGLMISAPPYEDESSQLFLISSPELLLEFLNARTSKQFAELCNRWGGASKENWSTVTKEQVEAFETYFRRGLMATVRSSTFLVGEAPYLQSLPHLESATLVQLLISHGANSHETDIRGVSLLHWACGSGNLGAVQALVRYWTLFSESIQDILQRPSEREGATPLHWAACGVQKDIFGSGGHLHVCQWLLSQLSNTDEQARAVNAVTKDGNTVLMWAAWSGSLHVVKFLMNDNMANLLPMNRNGCTVAHWAASGGNLELCQLLFSKHVPFLNIVNHSGNSPLSHAVFHGRKEVIEWLLSISDEDARAIDLAKEIVQWSTGDEKRREILDMMLAS